MTEEKSCCPEGSYPSKEASKLGAAGPVRGKVLKIDGNLAYITKPADANVEVRGVVVAFHDIFGFDSGRHQHFCDELADAGYVVILPDWFGKHFMKSKGIMSALSFSGTRKFLSKTTYPWSEVNKKLDSVKKYVIEGEHGRVPKAALGFCWGGWAVLKAIGSSNEDNFFSAAVMFHPALSLIHMHQGESYAKSVEEVTCPVLIMPAGYDPSAIRKDGFVIRELQKKAFGDKCEVVEFMQVKHGFAVRGDLKNAVIKDNYDKGMAKLKGYLSEIL